MVLSWDVLGDSMVRVGLIGVCFSTHCDGRNNFWEGGSGIGEDAASIDIEVKDRRASSGLYSLPTSRKYRD
jgi:hypothetical protein